MSPTTTTPTATDELRGHLVAPLERRLRLRAFAPPPRLTVSAWADRHRIISPEKNPTEHGRWHTTRTPYLKEIMDACTNPAVERVVFMKSARVGGTEVLNNIIGYHMDQAPCPILVLQPTVEDAKEWSKEDFAPMLRDTECLRGVVTESGRRDSRNTIQLKMFPGGYIAVVGSNSARGFRRRSIRIVAADEIDGYTSSARGGKHREGDPLALAIRRTQNVWNRLIYETSTPLIKGQSRIERDYEHSDQRRYYVPCPHCAYRQTLKWKNFRWQNRDPQTTVYVCGEIDTHGELLAGCGQPIPEEHKTWMVEHGEWRATQPDHLWRGYHIWTAYSLLTTWPRMVGEFLDAKDDVQALQAFVNTVLGETWEEKGEKVEPSVLAARREAYPAGAEVPAGVGLLTAGVDVQGDRLEYSVWGWGAEEEAWLVKHETLWGDPVRKEVWRELDLVLARVWTHETGATLTIRAACIDSGGHHTDQVYRYCHARRGRGVFATKGVSQPGSAPVGAPGLVANKTIRLFPLGTDTIKDSLYARLRLDTQGPRYIHFPFVDEEYFRQLTAERVFLRYSRGRPVRRYEKVYERNETLDCFVLSYAALLILGPVREQLAKLVAQLGAKRPATGPPAPQSLAQQKLQTLRRPSKKGGWAKGWQ